MRAPPVPPPSPSWRHVAVLLLGYVALDWASHIHPLHGLDITLWNPAPALALVFLQRFGRHGVVPLALAIFLADAWVRQLPLGLPLSLGLAATLALCYWAIGGLLRRCLGDGIFGSRRGLIEWALIIAGGTLINSLFHAGMLSWAQAIPPGSGQEALVRHWVGDVVGIVTFMPLVSMLHGERGRAQLAALARSGEALAQLATTAAALWLAFGLKTGADFQYFYVLFVPVFWAAARHGLAAAVVSAAMVQLGIIGAVILLGVAAVAVVDIQALAAGIALFGFFVGIVIDEKRRLSAELQQTLRLAAAGEMAGALAHELNQPLTALSAYGAACEKLLAQGESGERLQGAVHAMVAESHRAASVVRGLRDFFRSGATRLEAVPLGELLEAATAPFLAKARTQGIALEVEPAPPYVLFADRLQLQVVLRNLLSNAFEAVGERAPADRWVRLAAEADGGGRVCIRVEDGGHGLSGPMAVRLFQAFQSSKASGLGLGLAISRAIAEAHGGRLWAEVTDHGLFKLVLPIEGSSDGS